MLCSPALVPEAIALGLAIRSLFVGVFLAPDAVVVRGWFRDFRYPRGGLQAVTAVPYWKFLSKDDPILSLLKFTPDKGWVREISATVAWRDRTAAHAAKIRDHLGLPRPRLRSLRNPSTTEDAMVLTGIILGAVGVLFLVVGVITALRLRRFLSTAVAVQGKVVGFAKQTSNEGGSSTHAQVEFATAAGEVRDLHRTVADLRRTRRRAQRSPSPTTRRGRRTRASRPAGACG